jgi:hypothetical protein
MNIRERLQIRAVINLIISVIERLVGILERLKKSSKPQIDPSPEPNKPHKPRPLKRVIDTIDDIVPLPWRKK